MDFKVKTSALVNVKPCLPQLESMPEFGRLARDN